MLQQYPGVYWVDSSIRLLDNKMEIILQKVQESGGIGLFLQMGHSNFASMMNETATYLVTDINKQKSVLQYGAGIMLIYRTREVYENILKWAVLCSLEEECISKGTPHCKLRDNATWAGCSQFDETIVNILCSNYFEFNPEKYTTQENSFDVRKHSWGHQFPQTCY